MSKGFNFQQVKANLAKTKRELPVVLAKQAERYFNDAFKNGGMKGEDKWEEVQRRTPGTKAWKYPKKRGLSRRTSPILVRTGNLRRKVGNSIREAQWNRMRLVVDHIGADVHNDGAGPIPARPFMKHTETLGSMQKTEIKKYMDRVWKQ